MPTKQKNTVLITGFGPFPGVPENPSEILAFELTDHAQQAWPDHQFKTHIFATDWHSVQPELSRIFELHKPALALHFGTGRQPSALHIERQARNFASGDEDVAGCNRCHGPIHADAPSKLKTRLPLFTILNELRARGINAQLSNNAGSYLCNFLYYNSLLNAKADENPSVVGFIHIPTCIRTGARPSRRKNSNKNAAHLNWTELMNAGMTLISHGLQKARITQPLQPNQHRNMKALKTL